MMKRLEILIQVCTIKLEAGSNIEDILSFLRKNGCSRINCITVLLKLGYLPPNEAQYTKSLVHFSQTWADLRDTHHNWQSNKLGVLN